MTDFRAEHLANQRLRYETDGLDAQQADPNPTRQWHLWYDDAVAAQLTEPHAMTLATVDADGRPDVRVVLARAVDEAGFVFYTNYESAKSIQLDANPVAALNFAWLGIHRQVRVRGAVERVSAAQSDAYFASRPRGSQLGAWASPQSQPIDGRHVLDVGVAAAEARFGDDRGNGGVAEVPRPPHWGGWRVMPDTFEFWQGRPDRLHDRLRYERVGDVWRISRLAP